MTPWGWDRCRFLPQAWFCCHRAQGQGLMEPSGARTPILWFTECGFSKQWSCHSRLKQAEREQHKGLMASSPAMKLSPPSYKTSLITRERDWVRNREKDKGQNREGRERKKVEEITAFVSFLFLTVRFNKAWQKAYTVYCSKYIYIVHKFFLKDYVTEDCSNGC